MNPMTDTQPTETITDPAEIRATDEPDEHGDFPCCTTPAPVGAGLDLDAMARRYSTATDDEVIYEMYPALEAEVCRLTEEAREARDLTSIHSLAMLKAQERAEAAEAEVVTLRARLAEVEAKRDEFADLLARGEGEHVAREVFTADGIPFVRCSCTNAKSPTSSRWLAEHVPNGGVAELQAVVKRQADQA